MNVRIWKHRGGLILGLAVLTAAGALTAMVALPTRARSAAAPASAPPSPAVSGAEQGVATAEAQVRREPENIQAYHQLAVALMRAQRETGAPALYLRAEQALRKAEQRDPADYETRKLLAWVLAGQHRFDEALVLAREGARRNPNDFWNYGVIGDALTETGDYPGAVAAVQQMVDLRPGALSYARAANIRRLHGDPEGALELYQMSLEALSRGDRESRAWTHTEMGEIHFYSNNMEKAETAYAAALKAVPGYHLALAGQAHVFGARGKLAEAVETYQASLKQVERPDWRAALGDLYLAMGQQEQAEAQYVAVEQYLARHMDDPVADATHQLAQFLADRGRKPAQALVLARKEAADAQDIKANDTLAWALYHAGHYSEAWAAAQKALRLGTRDPKLLYHAGMIAGRLPAHRKEGEQLLRRALALNPKWDVLDAPAAQRALEAMAAG